MTPAAVKGKAFLGLLNLIVVLALLIFLSAGTLNFWQGWVYLFLFGLCCLLVTLYLMKRDIELLKRRLNAGPVGEKSSVQKIIQVFASLFFLSIISFPGLDQRWDWSQVPLYLTLFADLCVVLGFYVVFLVFKENTYTSAVIETSEAQTVTSTGPYARLRHPMYAGALLMLLATPLAMDSYWGLLFFPPICIVIIVRLLDEEKFLSLHLQGYTEYCKKVPYRLMPVLW